MIKQEEADRTHVTETFRESISKFKFSTPSITAPGDSSLRRSVRVATTAASPKLVVNHDVVPSPTPAKGKRKAPDGSPSKNAVKKLKRGYAPPETYAHLSSLTDCLAHGLDGV
jgi:hypothetical protein